MNLDNVIPTPNAVSPATLYANLPSSGSAFQATFNSTASNFSQFYDAVFNSREEGAATPYRYGSY